MRRIVVCAAVLFMLLCGSAVWVYGESSVSPSSVINRIGPGTVRIRLEEPAFEPEKVRTPGESFSKDPRVRNLGDKDIYTFLEITVPAGIIRTVSAGKTAGEAARTDWFAFRADPSWMLLDTQMTDNASVYIYGFGQKLCPGEQTVPLFSEMKTVSYLDGTFPDGKELLIGIRARAAACEGLTGDLSEAYAACLAGTGD